MSLFAIGDLHLSLSCDKSMDVFKGWENYVERLTENWNRLVSDEDTVVLVGDISWGMHFADIEKDFALINHKLKGDKIILKGNHDYWWNTLTKMNQFLDTHQYTRIRFLHNNAYRYETLAVCGSRGWINEQGEAAEKKVLLREAARLEASIQAGLKLGVVQPVVFVHYPPIYGNEENIEILDVLQRYGIKDCYYGHIHGAGAKRLFTGSRYGISFHVVSADLVDFCPQKVL